MVVLWYSNSAKICTPAARLLHLGRYPRKQQCGSRLHAALQRSRHRLHAEPGTALAVLFQAVPPHPAVSGSSVRPHVPFLQIARRSRRAGSDIPSYIIFCSRPAGTAARCRSPPPRCCRLCRPRCHDIGHICLHDQLLGLYDIDKADRHTDNQLRPEASPAWICSYKPYQRSRRVSHRIDQRTVQRRAALSTQTEARVTPSSLCLPAATSSSEIKQCASPPASCKLFLLIPESAIFVSVTIQAPFRSACCAICPLHDQKNTDSGYNQNLRRCG